MSGLWLPLLAILGGFIGLIWSADRFVAGSAALAHNFGISKLVIGLTIVAFGTSAPEIVVSISASLKQAGELAVGNALGSNLANIGLVLALTALIAPLPIQKHLLTREVPVLLLVTGLAGIFLYDAHLQTWEGWLLLLCLPLVLALLIFSKREDLTQLDEEIPDYSKLAASLWFAIGLAFLIASSEMLVWGAQHLALGFGVSPLVIGLTVIAVGTSLPELAASVASALRGHHDIALGNIIGSNIFYLLAVMALPALIQAPRMEPEVFSRDFVAMGLITLALVAAMVIDYLLRRGTGRPHLGRVIGTALLLGYLGYYYVLFT
jgi:cation:H+ antiporter